MCIVLYSQGNKSYIPIIARLSDPECIGTFATKTAAKGITNLSVCVCYNVCVCVCVCGGGGGVTVHSLLLDDANIHRVLLFTTIQEIHAVLTVFIGTISV